VPVSRVRPVGAKARRVATNTQVVVRWSWYPNGDPATMTITILLPPKSRLSDDVALRIQNLYESLAELKRATDPDLNA